LRGTVADEVNAGPMKEEAIARACFHDHWTQAVIDCVGTDAKPAACLDKLEEDQNLAYREKLRSWNDEFPDEKLDLPDEPEPEKPLECAFVIGDLAQYVKLALKSADRELAIAMRRSVLLPLCDDWSAEARKCFATQVMPSNCATKLEPDQATELHDKMLDIDHLFDRIATAGAQTCDKVVKVHYADDKWKLKSKDRKRLITESRARMVKACADEQWSEALRGCIVIEDSDRCWLAAGITTGTWGYPASGIPIKTGVAECDAYGDTLRALAACTQIPKQAAQTMLDNFKVMADGLTNIGAGKRIEAANSCKASEKAIRQSASSLGCTI
jgi:hypothetical protein